MTPPPARAAAGRLFRYGLAITGPVGSAGSQLLLSLVLLRVLDTAGFGRFSFLLVASQFSWGVWGALFCAPLPILLATGDAAEREQLGRTLFGANLLGAIVAAAAFVLIGLGVGESPAGAIVFAAYAGVALLRWFARTSAYARDQQLRVTASDGAYSLIVFAGAAALAWSGRGSFVLVAGTLLAGAVAGMMPFGRAYLRDQLARPRGADLLRYRAVWKRHSGWSLLGVVTTEATANAHAYIVTLILGAGAFAPIAASALMIRPVTVAMNALTEFERAQMARQIGEGRIDGALSAVRFFRWVMVAVWAATALAIVVLLRFAPHVIFPPRYALGFLQAGAALWMAVALIRLVRQPDNALLQAAGQFRPLAFASVLSSGVSIVAVFALVATGHILLSIVGVLVGEAAFAIAAIVQARRWLATVRHPSATRVDKD